MMNLDPTMESEINKTRLVKKLGALDAATAQEVCERLVELFQYCRDRDKATILTLRRQTLPNATPVRRAYHFI
jgi:mRNA-degrading endonuclease toxin of MazEF toxin-antitoxin module